MGDRTGDRARAIWTVVVVVALYLPILSIVLASLANTRFMRFPHRVWSFDAYREALGLDLTYDLQWTSLKIAACVAVLSVLLAIPGALAFARYQWSGRSVFQKALLLPIFFPQSVLGLAALVTMSVVGVSSSWQTAVFMHLVWVLPIVTLIVSIRLYGFDVSQEEAAFDLGATRFQSFMAVTLPQMMPGIASGALFAFLLSWANLPLSAYTSGADSTLPEWLFSRMSTNYAPMVPAVSVLSIVGSLVFVLVYQSVLAVWRRVRASRA
jgi:spermidine/putrescine transport system permease protein